MKSVDINHFVAWADLDNTPHVQYILPVLQAFEKLGFGSFVTAREYGQIRDLLRLKGVEARFVGEGFSKHTWLKVAQTLDRAFRLKNIVKPTNPLFCLSNSRAAALTSRLLSIQNFTFCDFEFSELRSYEMLGSYIVFPDVIPQERFLEVGFKPSQLISYPGLKEFITLSEFKIPNRCPVSMIDENNVLIILRPPSDTSHYYQGKTGILFNQLEQFLVNSSQKVEIVLLPRNGEQQQHYKKKYEKTRNVSVVENGLEGLDLMWFADMVFTGGGTMAREAAMLGTKAFSVFLSETGAVDRYLESIGKLQLIRCTEDIANLVIEKKRERIMDFQQYRSFPLDVAELIQTQLLK